MNLEGKKIAVVGLGESGVAACNLLVAKGAKVSVTDCQDNQKIRGNTQRLNKKDLVNIEIGRHSEDLIAAQDLIVTSPGVPMNSLPILWARKKGITVIGEIELAFAFCAAPIVAVTGTNGKTTVTTLLGEIFKAAGRKSVVCGNIGNPFSAEVAHLSNEHIIILEVSSFQLEAINKFKPKIAVILNLSADHLDRYANFNRYMEAKCRIFANQTADDWAVISEDNPYKLILAQKIKARTIFFKNKDRDVKFSHFNNNHFAALAISALFAIPEDVAINTCKLFRGIEHRLEEVGEINGVRFINDSKATNVDATVWALDSIKKPIILIAGGKDKGSNFTTIRESVRRKVRAIVLLGEAKEKLAEAFQDLVLTEKTTSLLQAVTEAFHLARSGDCVLFSPMCASFDMFSDYAERGRVFKQAVQKLVHSSQFTVHS